MNNFKVIFDTNGYRNLVKGIGLNEVEEKVAAIKRKEAAKGIDALLYDVTAKELLAHMLDDESSQNFQSCLRACKAMYAHCGDEDQYKAAPSIATQISKEYFGVINHKAIDTQKAIVQMVYTLWKEPSKDTINAHIEQFQKVATHVTDAEQLLIDSIKKYCSCIDPNYADWHLFVGDDRNRAKYLKGIRSEKFRTDTALAMLIAVYMQIADKCNPKHLAPEEMNQKVATFVKSYATALNIRQFFFEQLLNPMFDLTKKSRVNYMWDEQVLYIVGHSIESDPILLVTSDKKMLEAAQKECLGNYVITYDDYIKLLDT